MELSHIAHGSLQPISSSRTNQADSNQNGLEIRNLKPEEAKKLSLDLGQFFRSNPSIAFFSGRLLV